MVEVDEEAIDGATTDGVRELVEALRENPDVSVRLIFRYDGEEYDVAHVSDAVRERYTAAELERRIETLMMKGLGDPPHEQSLHEFGALRATVRWFDDAVCAYFPDEEWSGVIVVLDGGESPLVDLATDHLVG